MTYCAWFKVDQFTSNMQCVIGNDGSYRISRNGTTNTMRLWNDGLGGTLGGTSNVNDSNWHHVCGVIDSDGTNTQLYLYIDGQLENSVTKTGTLKPLVGDLFIGSDGIAYPNREWNGLIDDVRIYNCALDGGDIADIYNGSGPVVEDFICVVRPDGDLNNDCKVDYLDYLVLAKNWLK